MTVVIETTLQWRHGWPSERCLDGGEHYWRHELGAFTCVGCPAVLSEDEAQRWQRLRDYARFRGGLTAN